MKLKVSIAMALYNGEKYLVEQLSSILHQTREPDELIACDDGSTDTTKLVFDRFVEEHGLKKKWKYYRNENNLGYSENFLHAAELCSGDLIFYSDQDDIWVKNKIEKMLSKFYEHKNVEAVVCGYSPYIDGRVKNNFIEKLKTYREREGIVDFRVQVKDMLSGGLTLAVKKEALDEMIKMIRIHKLCYDVPIGLICASRGTLYRVNENLVLHRVHLNNTGDPIVSVNKRIRNLERHIKGRKFELQNMKAIREICENNLSKKQLRNLDKEIAHRMKSIELMYKEDCFSLFLQIFHKSAYGNKVMDIANFLCCMNSKKK